MRSKLNGLTTRQLRGWLLAFFIALAAPTGVLIYQSFSQLKWEAFHQHRLMAEELADRIRNRISLAVAQEEARGFADYSFLVVAGDPAANYVERSPLSAFPVSNTLPGVIGYFQVDSQGVLSTPLLPQSGTDAATFGIGSRELQQRQALAGSIHQILSSNRLVRSPAAADDAAGAIAALEDLPAESVAPTRQAAPLDNAISSFSKREAEIPAQAGFDRLNKAAPASKIVKKQKSATTLGKVDDLRLEKRYAQEAEEQKAVEEDADRRRKDDAARAARRELSSIAEIRQAEPMPQMAADEIAPPTTGIRVRTFESEIDPLEFSRLESGHFVLFRKVWRDEQRYIQGVLIDQQPFLRGMIESVFNETALAQVSDLIIAFQGEVVADFGEQPTPAAGRSDELRGALLLQTQLNAPMGDLHLIFSLNRLPAGAEAPLITWVAVILTLVLIGGFVFMYRLGVGQIRLARQQQDFVSAVSHELKTPLTSIRMYGEMLREGWASEEKKREYYDYIHNESERLSRLINNVLQLARMTRNDLQIQSSPVSVAELIDMLRSKVASQVEQAGYTLTVDCPEDVASRAIDIDKDYFTQIVINLVDNAVKFSAKSEKRAIDIGCRRLQDGAIGFTIRDYGPGIAKDQMKKIFRLFYRSENELTRETVGTGIGLALVNQLTTAMNGKVDVVNVDPGAEFRITFPSAG